MTTRPSTMTLAVFQATAEYRACRPKSQAWLTALVSNGFKYADATLAAYPACKTREKARVFSYAVRNWPKVAAALNVYLGRPPLEVAKIQRKRTIKQLVRLVRAQLAETEPGSTAAQRFTAQLQSLLLDTKVDAVADAPEVSKPQPGAAPTQSPSPKTVVPDSRIPDDALKVWLDESGACVGYRAADGTDVQF